VIEGVIENQGMNRKIIQAGNIENIILITSCPTRLISRVLFNRLNGNHQPLGSVRADVECEYLKAASIDVFELQSILRGTVFPRCKP
jgi:hypothetical protein